MTADFETKNPRFWVPLAAALGCQCLRDADNASIASAACVAINLATHYWLFLTQ
jgi:hypothetical protein